MWITVTGKVIPGIKAAVASISIIPAVSDHREVTDPVTGRVIDIADDRRPPSPVRRSLTGGYQCRKPSGLQSRFAMGRPGQHTDRDRFTVRS